MIGLVGVGLTYTITTYVLFTVMKAGTTATLILWVGWEHRRGITRAIQAMPVPQFFIIGLIIVLVQFILGCRILLASMSTVEQT